MKRIWLIRHGESMAQIDKSVSGVNPDLSPHGEDQARHLKARISQIESDIVLLSPLTRAWRTYLLSGYEASEVVYDQRLLESNWGKPNYYTNAMFEELPDIAKKDLSNNFSVSPQERASMLLDFVLETNHSSFLLFGHWGTFMHIFNAFVQSSENSRIITAFENTSISLLEINDDGKRSVVFWNDSSHLNTLTKRCSATR